MDVINSIIAMCATLAGLWTSSILHDTRTAPYESSIAVAETRTRSIDLRVDLGVRLAAPPTGGEPQRWRP